MIKIRNITKRYDKKVLNEVSYIFEKNKIYVIKGVSGCGKTTLLNIIGGIEDNYDGEYFYEDKNVAKMDKKQKEQLWQAFGYTFQHSLLLSNLTVLDNLLYINNDKELITKYARQLNVEPLLEKYPEQLSGGERQRISIIRTLILNPAVILADEPTASLDKVNSVEIAELFGTLRSGDRTIIIATHENYFDEIADEIIYLDYGVIGEVNHNEQREPVKQGRDESELKKIKGNSLKLLIPLIFRRHREKFRVSALLPLTFVIVAILICFSLQHNFYDECVKYCKRGYPMETFAISNSSYNLQLSLRYDNVKKFDLYVIQTNDYVCYPLLSQEDSVLAYGGLIKYGTFPKAANDVLISYKTASQMEGEDKVKNSIGKKLEIAGVEYIVSGVVADIQNDTTVETDIYEGDCYYYAADVINVYVPYETISKYGELRDIGNVMVKVDGLYDDADMYEDIKENIMGGWLSKWDVKLEDMVAMTEYVNKIILATFAVSAFMAILFIKNDIDIDLFYRRRELGYLQIFGVKKQTIKIQLILERMVKNTMALCLSLGFFYVVATMVKLATGINGFVTMGQVLILLLIVLGISFISVFLPIRKFLKKSVLSLITE